MTIAEASGMPPNAIVAGRDQVVPGCVDESPSSWPARRRLIQKDPACRERDRREEKGEKTSNALPLCRSVDADQRLRPHPPQGVCPEELGEAADDCQGRQQPHDHRERCGGQEERVNAGHH
jgi:hypothetical protein